MSTSRRRARFWVIAGLVVLASGVVVAMSDAGLPLPAVAVVAALSICLVAVLGMGAVEYRNSRASGRGVLRSARSAVRSSLRTAFDIF